MLNSLRKSSSSLFAWLLLGALALVFGLSFGLPSDTLTLGARPLATVHGERVTREDFAYQMSTVANFIGIPQDEQLQQLLGVREEVLDSIVERLVLDETAKSIGLSAIERDAEELTADGHIIVMGNTQYWLGSEPFNYDRFTKGLLRNLQVSQSRYLEFQRQEILARTLRDLVGATTVVPEAEVRRAYDLEADQLSLRYARFMAADYAELVDPTPEELTDYVSSHGRELEVEYDKAGARFSKLPARVRVRLIRVDVPAALPEDADAAARSQHKDKLAAARKSIEAAADRIAQGQPFAEVARAVSADATTRRNGGDLGWVNVEGTGSGQVPVVDEALRALAPGETSQVLTGEDGLYLVKVVARREAGDVPKDAALQELAEEHVRSARGRELAQKAAEEALVALRGGKTMTDLFGTKTADLENTPIEQLIDAAAREAETTAPAGSERPELRTTGLFSKSRPVPNLGNAPELIEAAWQADTDAEFIDRTFALDDSFVIAGVAERKQGSDEEFAERRLELARQLVDQKAAVVTALFSKHRCLHDKSNGGIDVDDTQVRSLLTYNTGEDDPLTRAYSVCDRAGMRGAMLRRARAFGG